MVLAMMSIGNLGLSIANSRDIYKINAKINAIIDNNSHVMIAEITKREPSDEPASIEKEEDDRSLELSPHLIYANLLISRMVYPNKTSSEAVKRDGNSRWGLGVSKVANTGDSIYGFVPPPPSASTSNPQKRLTFYNEENFVQGGIEAAYAFNQPSDGGWLSEQNNDYAQMDHEVSCLFDDLSGNTYAWQIYDNNHGGTIAGGAIRAFQYTTYKGQYLNSEIRGGVGRLQRCQVV
jgi:hypothetical protein